MATPFVLGSPRNRRGAHASNCDRLRGVVRGLRGKRNARVRSRHTNGPTQRREERLLLSPRWRLRVQLGPRDVLRSIAQPDLRLLTYIERGHNRCDRSYRAVRRVVVCGVGCAGSARFSGCRQESGRRDRVRVGEGSQRAKRVDESVAPLVARRLHRCVLSKGIRAMTINVNPLPPSQPSTVSPRRTPRERAPRDHPAASPHRARRASTSRSHAPSSPVPAA